MTELHKAAQQALGAFEDAMERLVDKHETDESANAARHAITALREALAKPAVPPGYALVPVEPTYVWAYRVIRNQQPHLDVGCKEWLKCLKEMLHWHEAMLAAAPQPKDKP